MSIAEYVAIAKQVGIGRAASGRGRDRGTARVSRGHRRHPARAITSSASSSAPCTRRARQIVSPPSASPHSRRGVRSSASRLRYCSPPSTRSARALAGRHRGPHSQGLHLAQAPLTAASSSRPTVRHRRPVAAPSTAPRGARARRCGFVRPAYDLHSRTVDLATILRSTCTARCAGRPPTAWTRRRCGRSRGQTTIADTPAPTFVGTSTRWCWLVPRRVCFEDLAQGNVQPEATKLLTCLVPALARARDRLGGLSSHAAPQRTCWS